MTDKEVLKESSRINGITLTEISVRAGYKTNSGVTNRLANKSAMRTDVFSRLLGTYGAKLIVRDKDGNEWEVE